jgi:hypothetical protein
MHVLCTLCEECIINIDEFVTGIFGGAFLGVRSATGLAFYDWDIQSQHVFWSDSGTHVCIATKESYFIVERRSASVWYSETKEKLTEDGVEVAFNVSLLLFDDMELSTV